MARQPKLQFAALALLAASSLPAAAIAQNGAWVTNSAGTSNWSQAGNWLDSVIADGADNSADFATAGLTGPITVNLDTPRTIGALVFDNPTNCLAGPSAAAIRSRSVPVQRPARSLASIIR